MRHDPASAAVLVMLRSLKMHGMAQAVGELLEQGAPAFDTAVPILSQLLKAELAEREVRSIAYQLKATDRVALDGYEASALPDLRKPNVELLHCDCTLGSLVQCGSCGTEPHVCRRPGGKPTWAPPALAALQRLSVEKATRQTIVC